MIDRKKLGFALSASFEDFARLPNAEVRGHGEFDRHIFIDNGCNILGVAHIDSVQSYRFHKVTDDAIACATVDDRIGVYMILYGLEFLGIKCDVLLTDHEEAGMSTGQFFKTDKQYNWMFQFDRGYDDAVTYQYDDPLFEDELMAAGFDVSGGICSDISYMEHLGCCGVNIGCGMRDYHSKNAYVDINSLLYHAMLFRFFWSTNRDRLFGYTPIPRIKKASSTKYWGKDDTYLWPGGWRSNFGPEEPTEDYEECAYCGNWQKRSDMRHVWGDDANVVCESCFNQIENAFLDDEFDLKEATKAEVKKAKGVLQ